MTQEEQERSAEKPAAVLQQRPEGPYLLGVLVAAGVLLVEPELELEREVAFLGPHQPARGSSR